MSRIVASAPDIRWRPLADGVSHGLMKMERVEPGDQARIRACHEIHVAANDVDSPEMPPMSLPMFAVLIGSGWVGDPRETWLAADGSGYCCLELPEQENRHLAMLELTVRPDRRRRGFGTALFNFVTERVGQLGRSTISTSAWAGSGGEDFARYVKFKPGITEVRRVLRVGAVPAAVPTPGYSVATWTGATPPEWLEQVAAVVAMIGDAPRDASWEAERWDPERVRRTDQRIAAQGLRPYSVAFLAGNGEMAAITQLAVDPERPDWGWQELTAVARPHRGHRLGMAAKVEMLALLAKAEPQLERILTWNAEENKHMVAINEELGFEVLPPLSRSWELELC